VLNWAVNWPDGLSKAEAEALGGPLPETSESGERTAYIIESMFDTVIPAQRPDLLTLWLTEPDHAQHHHGLRSPEALAMLSDLDARLEEMVDRLARISGEEGMTCFLISDHGFNTVAQRIDVEPALAEAGFGSAPEGPGTADGGSLPPLVKAGNSLYLNPPEDNRGRELVGDLLGYLAGQPWVSGIFVRDDLVEAHGGMTQSAVGGHHARSAPVMISMAWDNAINAQGVPGSVWSGGSIAATHGSASPYALNNTLIAWGAGIKRGLVSNVPCGIVDVMPTALQRLGVAAPDCDGRVLEELLVGGPHPDDVSVTKSACQATYRAGDGKRHQVARYSTAMGKRYLDQVRFR